MLFPQPSPGKVFGEPHKKQYVLKGVCNALAVQLFAIDERYEMRFVIQPTEGDPVYNRVCVFCCCRSIDFLPAVFQLFPVS